MQKVNLRVRRWGNSLGVVLPGFLVRDENLGEGSEIEVLVQTKNKTKGKDIFGMLRGKLRRSTAEILKEVDKDFEDK